MVHIETVYKRPKKKNQLHRQKVPQRRSGTEFKKVEERRTGALRLNLSTV